MSLKYTAEGTIATVLSTELNSLATSDQEVSSSQYSNDAAGERDVYAEYEVYLAAQGGARTGGNLVELAIIAEVDDANFPDWDDENLFDNYTVASWKVNAAATAVRFTVTDVKLPATDYKVVLRNETGQALAASDNTVKERRYTYTDV